MINRFLTAVIKSSLVTSLRLSGFNGLMSLRYNVVSSFGVAPVTGAVHAGASPVNQ